MYHARLVRLTVSQGVKTIADAVSGINAPRRTAEYNGGLSSQRRLTSST